MTATPSTPTPATTTAQFKVSRRDILSRSPPHKPQISSHNGRVLLLKISLGSFLRWPLPASYSVGFLACASCLPTKSAPAAVLVGVCLRRRRQNEKGRPIRGRTLAGDETGDVAMVQLSTLPASTGSPRTPDHIALPTEGATGAVDLKPYSEAGALSGMFSDEDGQVSDPETDSDDEVLEKATRVVTQLSTDGMIDNIAVGPAAPATRLPQTLATDAAAAPPAPSGADESNLFPLPDMSSYALRETDPVLAQMLEEEGEEEEEEEEESHVEQEDSHMGRAVRSGSKALSDFLSGSPASDGTT